MGIFKAVIEDKNEFAFFRAARYLKLDDDALTNVIRADFVGFLHRNPGAGEVRKNHEVENISNRKSQAVQLVDSWFDRND
jgi:hypothetical protein